MPIIEIPMPEAAKNVEGREVLRAFLTGNRLQVSLVRAFESPEMWGMLLADVGRRVAMVFAEDGKINDGQAIKMIADAFNAELAKQSSAIPGQQHRN